MYCKKCGAKNEDGALFCASCGESLAEQTPPSPPPTHEDNLESPPALPGILARLNPNFRPITFGALFVAVIFWFVAPFTIADPMEFITGEISSALQVVAAGENPDGRIFAIVTIIGLAVCLILNLLRKNKAVRIISVITAAATALYCIDIFNFVSELGSGVFDVSGFGYWGIIVLLIVAAVTSRKSKKTNTV